MRPVISQEQQALQARIDQAREKIASLETKRRAVDSKLSGMSEQRQKYVLLEQICESLNKLDELGAASLFWGEQQPAKEMLAHVARARSTASEFVQKVNAYEQDRSALDARIREEQDRVVDLKDELQDVQEREEAKKYEFIVDREMAPQGYRPMVMPWHKQGEDQRRFRKVMLLTLLFAFLFGTLTYVVKFPPRENEVVEIPERLVQLVKKEPPKPPEVKKPEEKKEEKPKEEKQKAREVAEQSGVLAFKDSFADLMQDSAALKLGADSRLSTSGQKANTSSRNLVVAQATGGSGGINTSSLSRDTGGGGSRVSGVSFSRVTSAVAGMREADRPLSDGPGPARTDEEIQIVFDRYKAALYRIYQRELRNDPTLRGKMVLKITIEPSGAVSMCAVQSSDLASAVLKDEVVERVKKFNFGPKDGVPRVTILYPIDFLPAS